MRMSTPDSDLNVDLIVASKSIILNKSCYLRNTLHLNSLDDGLEYIQPMVKATIDLLHCPIRYFWRNFGF
jgi:hypothetical protein